MAELPMMPFYTDAYLADTTHLTTEEHGAYLLLLVAAWRSPGCRLKDDDRFLARVVKCSEKRWAERLRPILVEFFTVAEGFWTQKKQTEIRAHVESVREKRREAAHARHEAKPLKKRRSGPAKAPANGLLYHNHIQDSDSSVPSESEPSVSSDEETSPLVAPAPVPVRQATPKAAAEAWNRIGDGVLEGCRDLTKKRLGPLRKLLADRCQNDLARWEAYCQRIRGIPFLCGDNSRGWRANIDFALRDETWVKVHEGRYDQRRGRQQGKPSVYDAILASNGHNADPFGTTVTSHEYH